MIRRMIQAMGGTEGEGLRWADVASGVGTTAAAAQAAATAEGIGFEYVAAAERNGKAARVNEMAWGRGKKGKRMYRGEAESRNWGRLRGRVDAIGVTLNCGKWSKLERKQGRERKTREALEEMGRVMRAVAAAEPRAVVVESVAEMLEGGERDAEGKQYEEVLKMAFPGMEWRAQALDAHRHGAAAMTRWRGFWVGVQGGWQEG